MCEEEAVSLYDRRNERYWKAAMNALLLVFLFTGDFGGEGKRRRARETPAA